MVTNNKVTNNEHVWLQCGHRAVERGFVRGAAGDPHHRRVWRARGHRHRLQRHLAVGAQGHEVPAAGEWRAPPPPNNERIHSK